MRDAQGRFTVQDKPLAVVSERSEGYFVWEQMGSDSLDRITRYLRSKGYRVQVERLPKRGKRIAHGLD